MVNAIFKSCPDFEDYCVEAIQSLLSILKGNSCCGILFQCRWLLDLLLSALQISQNGSID